MPIGIDIQVTTAGGQTRVAATAYDRLGWYFNKQLLWGEAVEDRKLTELLNIVRSTMGQSMLPERKATFNPECAAPEIREIYLARESRISSAAFFQTKGLRSSFQVSIQALKSFPKAPDTTRAKNS